MSRLHHRPRSTATRDRHRALIRRGEPPCSICHLPIDYGLPHLDPMAYVVDHVIPLAKGGLDVIENKAPAHRHCNRTKGDRLEVSKPKPLETTRSW